MLSAISWVLLIELISLAAVPLAFTVFRQLPDRGYAFAKVLGLLLTAWVVWFLGMLGLPFTQLNSWILMAVLFGGLDAWLLLRRGGQLQKEIGDFFGRKIWLVLAMELVFVLVYAYGVNLHSYRPDIRGTEKPGDFAFLNSLVLGTKLPPADPWMSGYTINYYYFSHFMMALLSKMLGTLPAVAFDLSIPLVMGLVAIECFGIVYNLVAAARRKGGAVVGWIALLAVLFVDFVGNLDSLRQIVAPRLDKLETPLSNFVFNTWNPSRVIWDYLPIPNNGTVTWTWFETINEFPFFSYMLADMHPHVMSLPFMLLAVAGALAVFFAPAGSLTFNLRRVEGVLTFFVLALTVGALIFINTWDYPTFLLLILLATFVCERRATFTIATMSEGWLKPATRLFLLGGELPANGLAYGRSVRYVGFAVRLVVMSVVLYVPFLLTFTSLVGDNIVPSQFDVPLLSSFGHLLGIVAWDRTPLFGYFLVFGVFILPMLSFLAIKVWPYFKNPYSYMPADFNPETDYPPVKFSVSLNLSLIVLGVGLVILLVSELLFLFNFNVFITLAWGLIADPIVAVGAGLLLAYFLEQLRPAQPSTELLAALAALALLMIGCGYYQHMELYGPLIIAVTLAALVLLFENGPHQIFKLQPDYGLNENLFKPGQATAPTLDASNNSYNRDFEDESVTVGRVEETPAQHELLKSDSFVLLLMILTGVINFAIEIIFLRDTYNSRFNTLFKFYYQSWVMYGLAAAYSVWRTLDFAWNAWAQRHSLEESHAETFESVATAHTSLEWPMAVAEAELTPAGVYQGQVTAYQPAYSGAASGGGAVEYTDFSNSSHNGYEDNEGYANYSNSLVDAPLKLDAQARHELEAAAMQAQSSSEGTGLRWWRWPWAFVMTALVLSGLIYAVLGPYEWTGHFVQRQGINGEAWFGREFPGDYSAVVWLRQQAQADPNFRQTMLEAYGDDWVNYSLVSAFSDYPTVMGWWGHEVQWRGGKEATRNEVYQRMQDVETIYSTTDAALAQQLLHKYNVKYVYVGSIETSASSGGSTNPDGTPKLKNYSAAALAKFKQFMHPIYNAGGVTIYSF